MSKKIGKEIFCNLPIRMVLMISLFPFVILLLLCSVTFYSSGIRQYTKLVKNNAEAVVEQCRNSLNRDLTSIEENAEGLSSQRAFYQMRKNIDEGKKPIEPVEYLQMTTAFNSFLQHYSTDIDAVGFYLIDNSIYYMQSNTGSEKDVLRYLDYTSFAGYENQWMWVSVADVLPEKITKNLPYELALIYPLGEANSHEIKGCLWIAVRNQTYLNSIENSKVTTGSDIVLFREDGTVISGMEDNLVEKMKELDRKYILQQVETKNTKEIESFDVADFYIVYTPLVIGDTGILAVIPKDELYVGFSGYKHVFLFILIAGLVLFIILYFLIPEYFSRPVTQLLEQMKGIREPGEDRKVDARGYREISQISDGVNDMMERITQLTESIQREMKAKQATQLQYLFAQINPHFLYNTLDCIKTLCSCNENDLAEEMLDQLVIFYRIGVSKGKSFIPLREELKHIRAYLSILQIRFDDFRFEIHMEEGLEQCVTLRMMLQPIVENALYHGIRPYRMDGTIYVDAVKKEDMVELHVKDDGGGMPEDVLEKINRSLQEPICDYSEKSYNVYGLKNVQDRIQIAYGKNYKIRIETEEDCGTEVIVTIPYEEEHK